MSKLICFGIQISIKKEYIVSFVLADGDEGGWNCKKVLQINCVDNIRHKIPFNDEEEALKIVNEIRKQLDE